MTSESAITVMVSRLANVTCVPADADIYDTGLSSIQALHLLLDLEEHFEVSLPDEEFVAARTVTALAELIERQKRP